MSDLILTGPARSDLGLPNIRTSTSHKVYRWRDLKFWADGGRIHVVNEKTGDHKSCARSVFLERAESFAAAIKKMKYGSDRRDHHQLLYLQSCAIQDAIGQGDPHDPRQLRDKLAQGRDRVVFGSIGPGAGVGNRYPVDRTPRYPDGSPFYADAGEGTVLLPTRGFQLG